MGVNGVESELAHVSVESGSEVNNINGGLGLSEPIKFGSHGTEEPIREANTNPEANFPKDAVDEWPEPKQIHYFYFIKYRSYDDQKLKAKLDQADKDLQRLNQARSQITEKLRAKRAVRAQVMTQIRSLTGETKQYNLIMDEKRKEMEPLTQALGTLRGPNSAFRDRGFICSSEEELNHLIKSLQYRIQHESIPLTEEKQILREIKQLEGTREQVLAKAAVRAKIQDSLGEKEAIQDQVKLIGGDLDGVRKERQVVRDKLKQHDNEKEAIEREINSLQDELTIVTEKRDKAFEKIQELRKQREDGNTPFYQNRTLLIKARELAAMKDVEALKELSDIEAEKFIALWSSTKAFRDDYEKRILPSLDIRQLSRDGRMRNPGEKPLVGQEAPAPPAEPEVLAKPKAKQPKEELVAPPQSNMNPTQKDQKEKNSKPQKEIKGTELEDTEEVYGLDKVEKDPPKRTEIDEVKLKELKREEEVAKAKQALERKKKLAEKAAAKAAIKAQKEAEKKLKDREKKAKKKLQASAPGPEEATETAEEVTEPEKADDNVEAAPVPSKAKERKESTIRQRGRAKGPESLSKVILKRKKSTNYWVWAAPVAACVLVLLVIGYNTFL